MPPAEPTTTDAPWMARAAGALERYGDPLLRSVANRLIKPRNQWSAEQLRERIVASLDDAVVLDRTLRSLAPACRKLLKLIGLSRQPLWHVQALVELLAAIGHPEGVGPLQELLGAGLMFPDLHDRMSPLGDFMTWMAQAATNPLAVFTVPRVADRARGEDLGLPLLPHETLPDATALETDGLEWPLRLAVAWQQVRESPLRRTQQRGFFKRDYDRLQSQPLLNAPAADQVTAVADPALLAIGLALAEGVLTESDDQIEAADFPAAWFEGLGPTVAGLWATLPLLEGYDPVTGWSAPDEGGRPFAGPVLFALARLDQLPESVWARPEDLDTALAENYPDWAKRTATGPSWSSAFLLGMAHQLRLVQAIKSRDAWWVRLSPIGRAVLNGKPVMARPLIEQTLLVQPNLEVVLFRQGLTPELIVRLTRFAGWKTLGPACTLTLNAETVYRGLEAGESLADITRLLERHGTRAVSDTVLESLRSWASKRERVQVYSSAMLLEFRTEADLNQAMKQGLVEVKLTDRHRPGLRREPDQLRPLSPGRHARLFGRRRALHRRRRRRPDVDRQRTPLGPAARIGAAPLRRADHACRR